jgi:streptogramin lyase
MKTPSINHRPIGLYSIASRRSLQAILWMGLLILSLGNVAQARVRAFPIPTPMSQPISITFGPDGNFWFTEQDTSQVARITPQGVITEFRTPTFSFPNDITAGPDGNVWFTEGSTGKIGLLLRKGTLPRLPFRPSMPLSALLPARMETSGLPMLLGTIYGAWISPLIF